MSKKVSIREIVATKIVFSILLSVFYWMFSRSDWKPEYHHYQSIWGMFLVLVLIFHFIRVNKYKKENVDEFAEQNLRRCDSIFLKVLVTISIVTAFLGGILGHINSISTTDIGWILIISIVVISILRTVVFIVMDTKGV